MSGRERGKANWGTRRKLGVFALWGFTLTGKATAEIFPFMISCTTAPKATRSLVVKAEGEKVSLQYYNSADFEETQIHFGPVYAKQIKDLDKYKKTAALIGRNLTANFDLKRCRYGGDSIFRCENYGNPPESLNGHKVLVGSVFSELLASHSLNGQYLTHTVYMNVQVDGEWVVLPLTYDRGECKTIARDALPEGALPEDLKNRKNWKQGA